MKKTTRQGLIFGTGAAAAVAGELLKIGLLTGIGLAIMVPMGGWLLITLKRLRKKVEKGIG